MPEPPAPSARAPYPFHVLAKPIGPSCNLGCEYCFYSYKEEYFPKGQSLRMTDEVLESFVRQYIEVQPTPEISFAWQGGEPTLLGVGFFRRAVELQKKHCPAGKTVSNAFQTNGILLDDEWCAFLKEHDFLVGLSLDGPPELHDTYRRDRQGRPTCAAVRRGLDLLQKHGVRVNALTVVSHANGPHGRRVYRFLRDECGLRHMQFIPCAERRDFTRAPQASGRRQRQTDPRLLATPWSVGPEQYGRFLCAVFDEWLAHDLGRVFVQTFEATLGLIMGLPASVCVFGPHCGRALALEHDGTLYSCDHFVYPEYALGNLREKGLAELVTAPFQWQFGRAKLEALPRHCRRCDFLRLCYGECPRSRFIPTPQGEPGLNYLCAGLQIYFAHVLPHLGRIARELRAAPT